MAGKKGKKGKRKGGQRKSKKAVRRVKSHKPGAAETVGVLWTGGKVAIAAVPSGKYLLANPNMGAVEGMAKNIWNTAKANAEPAIVGILISNANKLPIIGKPLAPFKRKLDVVFKQWFGMRL